MGVNKDMLGFVRDKEGCTSLNKLVIKNITYHAEVILERSNSIQLISEMVQNELIDYGESQNMYNNVVDKLYRDIKYLKDFLIKMDNN